MTKMHPIIFIQPKTGSGAVPAIHPELYFFSLQVARDGCRSLFLGSKGGQGGRVAVPDLWRTDHVDRLVTKGLLRKRGLLLLLRLRLRVLYGSS